MYRVSLPALVILAALTLVAASCDVFGSTGKMVNDATPFIVATLEASPDTAIHYPQVFVGTLTDPQDPRYDFLRDPTRDVGEGLFQPDLWAQVMIKAAYVELRADPTEGAQVSLTGPLGAPEARTAVLMYEGSGVYGDVGNALPLSPDARYRLDVRLPDGRAYTAQTHTPPPYHISAPDTLHSATEYIYHGPGQWTEWGTEVPIDCAPALNANAPLTTYKFNAQLEFDHEVFLLDPGERFAFQDRGEHLRDGSRYVISTHGAYSDYRNLCGVVFGTDANTSRWDRTPVYMRVAQMSSDLARYYEAPYSQIAFRPQEGDPLWDDPWDDNVVDAREDAGAIRDRTYLPRISNIRSVGPDGEPLAETDAVGVFGGLTARYLTRTLVPIRSFDPDTLDWTYHPSHPD